MLASPIKYNFKLRVIITGLILGMLYGVIIARAVDLMVFQRPKLKELAQKQHQKVERTAPKRGAILDCSGAPLAESVPVDSVYAHPRLVSDPAAAAQLLSQILNEKEDDVLQKLTSGSRFVWIKRVVSPEQAKTIRQSAIPGIVVAGEYARYYPQGMFASNVVGFVGSDGLGLEGIEKKFNDDLAGLEETVVVQRDARGKPLFQDPDFLPEPRRGSRLILTLDSRVQALVEDALERAVAGAEAEKGMAAVMEVRTGKILAMAVRPTFNPNRFRDYPKETYRNRFIADVFEPGSTFKTFTVSALLDSRKGNINDEIYCEEGAFEIDGYIINDTHSYGWFTVEEVIVHSSNIGAGKLGLKLGRDLMGKYVADFGFGAQTGIDLPGESKGLVRPFRKISRVGVANTAFGQGIGVTGIQLLTGLNAIASGGKLITPRVVDRIMDEDGKTIQSVQTQSARTVLRPETVALLKRILINVVHGGGTGSLAAPAGYTVAGKTGTAQKVNLEIGGYYDDRYVASFMGFAPAENPLISVIVIVDDPKGLPWGGTIAAPVFREVVERTLPLFGVLPNRPFQENAQVASADPNQMVSPTVNTAAEFAPATRETIVCQNCMPDLRGLSLREVLKLATQYGVSLEINGGGRVRTQKPAPGTPLSSAKAWRVEFGVDPNW